MLENIRDSRALEGTAAASAEPSALPAGRALAERPEGIESDAPEQSTLGFSDRGTHLIRLASHFFNRRGRRFEQLSDEQQHIFSPIYREAYSQVASYLDQRVGSHKPAPQVRFRRMRSNTLEGYHLQQEHTIVLRYSLLRELSQSTRRTASLEKQLSSSRNAERRATLADKLEHLYRQGDAQQQALKHAATHELLHEMSFDTPYSRDGSLFLTGMVRLGSDGKRQNRGLDEGITEWITHRIQGKDENRFYDSTVTAIETLAEALQRNGYNPEELFLDAYIKGDLAALGTAIQSLGGLSLQQFSLFCDRLTYGRQASSLEFLQSQLAFLRTQWGLGDEQQDSGS